MAYDHQEERPATRQETQVRLILEAFSEPPNRAAVDPPDWERTGEVNYLYRDGSVLVRDRDLDRVRALFDGAGVVHDGGMNGLTRYDPPEEFAIPDDVPVPDLASPTLRNLFYVDYRLGVGVVTPDHVLYVVPVQPCPATEPEEVPIEAEPDPGVSEDPCDGRGVKVAIVDVGWSPSAKPWLADVEGDVENAIQNGVIQPYAGHGTFIAGVLRCMAPKAEVYVEGMLTRAGATFESELVPQLNQALDKSPDIISLSAGTHTRMQLPMLGFDVFWEERLSKLSGVVLVAAAGNNSRRDPFYPAALSGTVSVGALGANWRNRADFSNFGSWVRVYAPGKYLTNAFLTGDYRCFEEPRIGERRRFDGMAQWSGTSFSTPLVAGLIAARMSATGENAREASDALLRFARTQAIPGVGAVLLPGQACADLQAESAKCCCSRQPAHCCPCCCSRHPASHRRF